MIELKNGDYVKVFQYNYYVGKHVEFFGRITHIYFKSWCEEYRKYVIRMPNGKIDIFERKQLEKISEENYLLESL
jgi:hypothetical protein